eukprot:TRINITY_DN2585_c0_g1_i1.p1 TRINITY_DN2585_c0_g1~~TRINITY_DN2585_c0_g1_i1.p1  ORF type:complete len:371 (+),score=109.64 TRINITY_DN2585_c0_g1_i1:394-1506(+)
MDGEPKKRKKAAEEMVQKREEKIKEQKVYWQTRMDDLKRRIELQNDPNASNEEKDIQGHFFDLEKIKALQRKLPYLGPSPLPTIKVELRTYRGKKCEKLREMGYVPAVLQGKGLSPLLLQIPKAQMQSLSARVRHWAGKKYVLSIEGEAQLALIRSVQLDPVTLQPKCIILQRETEITPGDVDQDLKNLEENEVRRKQLIPPVPQAPWWLKKALPGVEYDHHWWRYRPDPPRGEMEWKGQEYYEQEQKMKTERLLKLDRLKVEKTVLAEVGKEPGDEFYEGLEEADDDRVDWETAMTEEVTYITAQGEEVPRPPQLARRRKLILTNEARGGFDEEEEKKADGSAAAKGDAKKKEEGAGAGAGAGDKAKKK